MNGLVIFAQIVRDVDATDAALTSVSMLTAASGSVRSSPLTVPGESSQYQIHSSTISKMKITFEDQYLVLSEVCYQQYCKTN